MMQGDYSLWLIPPTELIEGFGKTIHSLSHLFGGPIFEPHVTLIGGLSGDQSDFISASEKLARSIRPFEITVKGPDHSNEFFRCIFLRVELNDSISTANLKARAMFVKVNEPPFEPHLSLFYGNLREEIREQIVSSYGPYECKTFAVDHLHLVSVTGDSAKWFHVRKFSLL